MSESQPLVFRPLLIQMVRHSRATRSQSELTVLHCASGLPSLLLIQPAAPRTAACRGLSRGHRRPQQQPLPQRATIDAITVIRRQCSPSSRLQHCTSSIYQRPPAWSCPTAHSRCGTTAITSTSAAAAAAVQAATSSPATDETAESAAARASWPRAYRRGSAQNVHRGSVGAAWQVRHCGPH